MKDGSRSEMRHKKCNGRTPFNGGRRDQFTKACVLLAGLRPGPSEQKPEDKQENDAQHQDDERSFKKSDEHGFNDISAEYRTKDETRGRGGSESEGNSLKCPVGD